MRGEYMNLFNERQRTNNTRMFLYTISKRLASRQDAQSCEYNINIVRLGDKTIVDMSPLFYIYPNTHRRSDLDKMTIVDYSMKKMFSNNVRYRLNNSVQIVIEDDCFVPGCYAYARYENANRRKWIKTIDFKNDTKGEFL